MRFLLVLALVSLAACEQEEDFDTRFERTKADLEYRSEILERDLAARKARGEEEVVQTEEPSGAPSNSDAAEPLTSE